MGGPHAPDVALLRCLPCEGFSFNIHPQYVGEISPKRLRGFTNATVAVFLTFGKVAGQVIGLG